MHKQHKVLEIDDEESLKKENISIDNSTKEFDENIRKLNNLKNTIEKEMSEIDKQYEIADTKATKSFELKIEKLKKEEEDLKEELKTEVTKVKEKLENYISLINNLTKICERIIKGIKSLQNEEGKNMIKTLSYVSNINKNQKDINILTHELMKNLKISFIEDENQIKYEEYYFNGIPIPQDIDFKEIGTSNFKVFWKIDDNKVLHLDKNQIKYNIEIRIENQNDKFIKVYEGDNNNCIINNLKHKSTYEIRICAIYKEIKGNWSELKKVKTKDIDSKILDESENGIEFFEKLYEWIGYKNMELIYRGTRDGTGSDIFHNKCDNQGPTIVLCKNEKGNIFGGYSSISWTSDKGNFHSADNCFLFTLTNIYGIIPTKFPNINSNQAVYHCSNYGPTFGSGYGLKIYGDFLNDSHSYATIGKDYKDILGKGFSIFSGDVNNKNFKLKELEVFKIVD